MDTEELGRGNQKQDMLSVFSLCQKRGMKVRCALWNRQTMGKQKKCSNDLVTIRIAGIGHKNVQRWMRYYKTMWMTWSH